MKSVILSLLAFASLAQAELIPTGNIALPYGDFRKLVESAQSRLTPMPLEASIVATRISVDAGTAPASATIAFDVQSFGDVPQLVPLIGTEVTVRKYEPEGATLVVKDGFYQVLVQGSKRQTITLQAGWKGAGKESAVTYRCSLRPSAIREMTIRGVRDGSVVEVAGAEADAGTYHLAGGEDVTVVISAHATKPSGEAVPMPPVVTSSTSEMRLVRDGTFLNKSEWMLRHSAAFVWRLQLGDATEIVSCLVNGKPVAPILSANVLEIPLPEPAGQTKVELSYTGKTEPMAPVRGDLAVSLPSTDLLVESIEWRLRLPAAYVPIAVEGNADLAPGSSQNQLLLQKELCRGESPSVRIFYQKPETTTKP